MQRVAIGVLERNAVRVTGDGPPMVLVHGFGCDQSMWDSLVPFLEDWQLVRYDLTGMGASDYGAYSRDRHGGLGGHAEDLIEILDALRGPPAIAVGHSVSALIAGLAAAQRPDLFQQLVMLSPSPSYLNDGAYVGGYERADIDGLLAAMRDNYQGWAGQLASMVAGAQDSDSVKDTLEARFCRNDPEISQHFAEVTFLSDHRADLPRMSTPTLIVHCDDDVVSSPDVVAFVEHALPTAQRVMLAGSGHAPHMTHPAQTAGAMKRFLHP